MQNDDDTAPVFVLVCLIAAAAIAVLGILILLISNGGWKQAGALVLMLALATRLAGIPR